MRAAFLWFINKRRWRNLVCVCTSNEFALVPIKLLIRKVKVYACYFLCIIIICLSTLTPYTPYNRARHSKFIFLVMMCVYMCV